MPELYLHSAPLNGPALQSWRKGQEWTQKEAADWYGVHERTWRRYESAPAIPMRLWKRIDEYNHHLNGSSK